MNSNTTGSENTAMGVSALYYNNGSYNTAIGRQALLNNTTASNNTAVGYQAGYSNTTGIFNTNFGNQAGYSNTTSQRNTLIGHFSGYSVTGGYNTFAGQNSGYLITTGTKNTILGSYSGNQGGLDIRTSSNNIVLSDGDGNLRVWADSDSRVRVPDGSNFDTYFNNDGGYGKQLTFGNTYGGGKGYAIFQYNGGTIGSISSNGTTGVSYNTSSDYRLKENVVDLTGATDRLKQIPVHQFNFIGEPDRTVDGFLAHEVQAIVPEAIHGTHNEVDADGNPVYQGIDQSKLVPLLVATIKELEARITALENV
jgi:hypothetical protein